MKKALIGAGFVGMSLVVWGFAGCGKKEASCDLVFEHVKGLAPADVQDVFELSKDQMLDGCEKLTLDQRKCILAATDIGSVAECKRK
jgi:hypothetical protein